MLHCHNKSEYLKTTLELQTKKKKNRKTCFCDIRSVLHWIFILFGLDLNYPHITNVKSKITWFSLRLTIILLFFTFFRFYAIPNIEFNGNMNDEMKSHYSSLIIMVCSVIIYFILLYTRTEIANVTNNINKLKRLNFKKCLNLLPSTCIFFLIIEFVLRIMLILYPYSEKRYDYLIFSFYSSYLNSKTLKHFVLYIDTFVHEYFHHLLPNSLIILYIITCHDIAVILSSHVKRLEMDSLVCTKRLFKLFNDYQNILSSIQAFESTFNMLIFVSFISKITTLFTSIVLSASYFSLMFVSFNIIVNFAYITLIFEAAESISEYDKIAKEFSLKILEKMLTNTHVSISKIFTIWRSNNSPAFTLTAWRFFSFTRESYLSCLGTIITYSLLIKNL